MATKTTFYGTIFTFNDGGVNDVIQGFRNSYEEAGEVAPFIGYDRKNHVFKIDKLELLDETTPVDVLRQLQTYTQQYSRDNEVLDPKIQTRDGFSARYATEYGDVRSSDLLDVDLDDPEDTTAEATASLQQASLEWKPCCENIKILTNSVAQRIASTTGAFLHPDSNQNQVRLLQNNVELARQKLVNIETLLLFQYEQRNSESPMPVPNLLISSDDSLKPLLGFQRINFDRCPSYQRVIVPHQLAQQLPNRYLCEGRVFKDGRKAPHPNLDLAESDATDRLTKSTIWDRWSFRKAGNPPARKTASETPRIASSEVGSVPRLATQKYLGLSRAAELQDWSGNITSGGNPNDIEPEAPAAETTSRRRRRVAIDSDEEDEAPSAPVVVQNPIFDLGSELQSPVNGSDGRVSDLREGDVDQIQHTFDDDGQLLEGLPYDEIRPQFSPAPSQLPSNLMSLTSGDSPDTRNSARLGGHLNGHSSSSSHLPGEWNVPYSSSGGDGQQASSGRGGKVMRCRGGSFVGAQPSFSSVRPPPGLSYPSNAPESTAQSDVQWSEIMRRSNEPVVDRSVLENFSRRKEPAAVDVTSKHWVNTTKVGINADARRDEVIERMRRQAERQPASSPADGQQKDYSTVSNRGNRQKKSRGGGGQRKAEYQQPRFRNTMRQQARNPGKRGDKSSAASRKQKIDGIYGSIGPPAVTPSTSNGPKFSDMSSSKQKLLSTNPTMANANIDAVQQGRRVEEATRLKSQLEPFFEHARAFSGKLDFGISFGQVLLPADPHTNKSKNFGVRQWNQTFVESGPNAPITTFTPILTSNGADLDRALEMRSHGGIKLFDQYIPGPSSVTFEFQCENASGERFLVDVNQDLAYHLHHSTDSLGMVHMQCPSRVWDAAAVLQGTEAWVDPRTGQAPEAEADAVKRFVDGIYIPAGHRLNLYFRYPEGNIMTVKNVMMKRISLHACLLPGYEDVQLRITEYMNLSMRTAPNDKRLFMAVDPDHAQLYSEDAIQYEMSLVDSSINAALHVNNGLEIGELTDPSTTGKSLLGQERVQRLLDLTVSVLSKIDWMGLHNIGTMIRLDQKRAKQEQSLTLPPNLQSQLYMAASRLSSQLASGSATSFGGSQAGTEMPIFVHGTRAGTRAVLQRDEAGWFQKGLGGARVPVPDASLDVLESASEDLVLPEDSASQVGMPRTVGAGAGSARRRGAPVPWSPVDDKPQGFW